MFCKNCGAEIKNNGRFCPKCGQEVKIISKEAVVNSPNREIMEEIPRISVQDTQKSEQLQKSTMSEQNLAPVMSIWSYLGLFLLASIPIAGIIIIIIFAISSNNQNKTNYCRAIILGQVILFLIVVVFWSSLTGMLAGALY